MNDEDRKQRARYLEDMLNSPGGQILFKHIEEEIIDGWEKFIEMPCDQKTSKAAFTAQSRYIVLKNIKEWIDSEINLGHQIS